VPGDDEMPHPIPRDPALAEVAIALRDAGHWAFVVDDRWRVVYATDEIRRTLSGLAGLAPCALGQHLFGPEQMRLSTQWVFGPNTPELQRRNFLDLGPWCLADTPGGRDALREIVDPPLRELVDELSTVAETTATSLTSYMGRMLWQDPAAVPCVGLRVRDATGELAGTALIYKPEPGMTTIAEMTTHGDLRHFERMQSVAKAGRRPAAILFADLDASTPLSKRLPTATYFTFGRRLMRAGLIGRHAGDGVVAFFLAETEGSESAAARACIAAARSLGAAVRRVGETTELPPGDVVLRFGLHWGSTVYVGYVTTGGRTEVNALGDEVNEAARIEACATGGRVLASKVLIERLVPGDAQALGIDLSHVAYTRVADLATATEKARRDAPAVAVCDLGDNPV
jgi:class 3 adenylate cyclase